MANIVLDSYGDVLKDYTPVFVAGGAAQNAARAAAVSPETVNFSVSLVMPRSTYYHQDLLYILVVLATTIWRVN